MNPEIGLEGELAENVLKELKDEFLSRVTLADAGKTSPSEVLNQAAIEDERKSIKNDIAKAFFISNSTQRMYFIVRSLMMTIFGAIITLAVFWQLGKINVFEDFALGASLYAISLIISRLFDAEIVSISKYLVGYLGKHPKLRDFIIKNV